MPHPIVGERLTIKIKSPNKLLFGRNFNLLASPIEKSTRWDLVREISSSLGRDWEYGRGKKSAPHLCDAKNWCDSYQGTTIPHEQRGTREHQTSHSKALRTRCFGPLSVFLEYSIAAS